MLSKLVAVRTEPWQTIRWACCAIAMRPCFLVGWYAGPSWSKVGNADLSQRESRSHRLPVRRAARPRRLATHPSSAVGLLALFKSATTHQGRVQAARVSAPRLAVGYIMVMACAVASARPRDCPRPPASDTYGIAPERNMLSFLR